MKLWLLRPRDDFSDRGLRNPWEPWYDKAFGFVVRAETEADARQLAAGSGRDEKSEYLDKEPWLDSSYSICLELLPDGEPGIIIRDFAAA